MEKQTLAIPQGLDLPSSAIRQSTEWKSSVWGRVMKELDTRRVLSINYDSIGDYQAPFPVIDQKFLPKIDDALGFLNMKMAGFIEGIFFNFTGTLRRPPGFVVDVRIIIPEYDRKLEHKIYHALADIIRKNPELLFDAHVIASKGRRIQDFLPYGYHRYITWSG